VWLGGLLKAHGEDVQRELVENWLKNWLNEASSHDRIFGRALKVGQDFI
jgi:hypothetical protein